ncbi:hypothetical protein CMI37_28560 [Candidatus Pacearchaeota archaeon]|nr:hypothetical protein [Candidatus Pacearchaeota archaeon]
MNKRTKKNQNETDDKNCLWVDDIRRHERQKKYFKTRKGKKALSRARKKYDEKDRERRRKQKRQYMRRKREKDPKIWRV